MDKNKIKSFAIWARRKLISSVSERANRIGITEKKIKEAVTVQGGFKLEGNDEIFKLSKEHRDKLVNEVKEKGFEQVMEEVAYTWFNRFMGLRYMEVNDYLPSGIRVLSSVVEGKTEPDVLTRVPDVIDELKLKPDYIYALLDSGKTEDREEAYKHILVKQCNELGNIIPQMFEKISDYTELLLPDNLLEEGSVIRRMIDDIKEEDWEEEVEIIGWMYQYYISEKKDEVFAALKNNIKITKENIPAATQLFTPKWIVKYMVENSLGRLWLEGHPNEELQKQWKYYLEEAEQEPEVEEELKIIREEHSKLKPEDIKILDPCMGSGHILVYAFDVLYEIYKTAGYSEREIPRLILQNNLYGLDIDDRAAQLASFALIMKARHYNRRLFREIEKEYLELNLCSIQESNSIHKEAINYFVGSNEELRKDIEYLVKVFTDAKEYGSILEVREVNFKELKERLCELENEDNLIFSDYRKILIEKIPLLVNQAKVISNKYNSCITNPPYMGNKGMSDKLQSYLKVKFKKSNGDFSTVFMEKCISNVMKTGYVAMINIPSWMFLSTFKVLREELIKETNFTNMLHLGRGVFGSDFGTTAFVLNNKRVQNFRGIFKRLFRETGSVDNINRKEEMFFEDNNKYLTKQDQFLKITGFPIAYWANQNIFNLFENENKIENSFIPKFGMSVGDGTKFVRSWYEVNINDIEFNAKDENEYMKKNLTWNVVDKGGAFRRWYGNRENIVKWKDNGKEIRCNPKAAVRSPQYFFKPHISWTLVTMGKFSARFFEKGFILDTASNCIYFNKDVEYKILGFLNTSVAANLIELINPTINSSCGIIGAIPYIDISDDLLVPKIKECIDLCKENWNEYEISWEYKKHYFCKCKANLIEMLFQNYTKYKDVKIEKLKKNEIYINNIYSEYYMDGNLCNDIDEKYISVKKDTKDESVKSFISYAVGCILGRYSIDAEGLIYAGGDFKDKWNLEDKKVRKIENDEDGNIILDSWVDATFLPDGDNIIPITEDEYFEDDIVSRFIDFVRIVYSDETLEENLDFIADSISRKPSETARQAIRRYFIKDFYKNHLKVYQKRPIYWMFDSGKNDGFKALVYMHRYNEQTVAKVRTDYLHTLQRKYEAEMQRQQLIVDSEEYAVKDRAFAKKKIDRISKQIEECREYDQVVAHLANEKISIDLDDGVKVNYEKFQGVKFINAKDKEVKMDLLAKI